MLTTDQLVRRVRLLVATSIAYNVVEAVVALTAGAAASSAALVGFGLDSVIEVSSAVAVAWQFSATDPQRREARALRATGLSFYALAAFVTLDALLGSRHPGSSLVGVLLAAVSVVVMPVLSLAQRRAGRALGSASAVAGAGQTLLCTYLSGVLLLGLVVRSLLGWTWADRAAALVIAVLAVQEGRAALRGDGCCTPLSRELPVRVQPMASSCCESCSC